MSVNLVTEDGMQQLQDDLAALQQERPEIKDRLEEARSRGDLSENAEYHAAREELAMLESKIREMEERIKNSKIIDNDAVPDDMVTVGHTVLLEDAADGEEQKIRLVGEGEPTGPQGDVIVVSTSSPIGEALFKARVGEKIVVAAPRGKMRFVVKEIL